MMLQKLDRFHKTRPGYLVFGIVELGLVALFARLAIDSGSLWEYALVIIFVFGTLQNIVMLIGKIIHGGKN